MSASLPAGYTGPSLSAEVLAFLTLLRRHGFQQAVTTEHAGKTINLEHGGIRYGYINGSVLSRRGTVGYRFVGMNHPYNGVPVYELQDFANRFCTKYDCELDDLSLQEGGGSNAGRGFLIIANPTVALRVLLQDAQLPVIPGLEVTRVEETFVEGLVRDVTLQQLERSSAARRKCLEHHGYACAACGIRLRDHYSGLPIDVVHVHHLAPLASRPGRRQVSPAVDLLPVCPNCHAVIHSREPEYSIAEVRGMLSRDVS